MRPAKTAGAAAALCAIAISAGCASTSGGGNAPGGTAQQTVSVRQISGVGATLVTTSGETLYFTDQDASGKIQCVQACVRIWQPLTVPAGDKPSGTGDIAGALATAARPDGTLQVLYQGRPLYTFSMDSGAGRADGNGVHDAFDGTNFTWHAATTAGSPSTTPSSTNSGGYGGGNGY